MILRQTKSFSTQSKESLRKDNTTLLFCWCPGTQDAMNKLELWVSHEWNIDFCCHIKINWISGSRDNTRSKVLVFHPFESCSILSTIYGSPNTIHGLLSPARYKPEVRDRRNLSIAGRGLITYIHHLKNGTELIFLLFSRDEQVTWDWDNAPDPLLSWERKKRTDIRSSWMQQRNSSSFCPPVARENSLRDWTIYLKIYSCALKQSLQK